ncbi:MAG: amidohydrolase family protein [Armatimonadota bacterium]|nr:MAG: amidohydrolase family protein [Armatimonadota bacterium]
MIDIHTHLGRGARRDDAPVDESELLRRLDEFGIDKAVVLARGVSPECAFFHFTNEDVLAACARHADRFVPFCKLDPRNGRNSPDTDFSWVLEHYKATGCRGVGEVSANMLIDDPRCVNMFHHCGAADMPVLFHLVPRVDYGLYGLADDIGLPRLERVLQECPETVFIGHAMAFWAEVASNVEEETRGGYPKGPVAGPGRVPGLLKEYSNLYGDLSAGSGFNAISRDPEFGCRFLEDHQDRLLFGTDICNVNQEVPIVPWLNEARDAGRISPTCYEKLVRGNATQLLGLE